MPSRSELLEEERNYRLVKREKEEHGKLIKQLIRFFFSQVGVVLLGALTAVLGIDITLIDFFHGTSAQQLLS